MSDEKRDDGYRESRIEGAIVNHFNTSREMYVGQPVHVEFDGEVASIPDPMDYSDTVSIRDANNGLLVSQVQARNVRPIPAAAGEPELGPRFFLDVDGDGYETLWIETSHPDRPEPVISESDRGFRNNPGAWAFLVSAVRAAGVGSMEGENDE